MRTIGTIVAIVGLASIVNHAAGGEQMEVLEWSEAHQPLAGIGIGVLGVFLVVVGAAVARNR
ncbi:hypothetical protein [Actinomadura algeriensis]|uniref:Drug/metabolite transporter (DMT)-like permease n=1 Tax=Actinomadura algeriensis TaxID=1679523 RepID=A0ABR9K0G5_9ACTN|nr:hypothetical protein [Actinomadura algeriensis]MBE1536133.1 drug/metabolite transporter (DMT)-like permease [Actinomadura algeriensis]